MSNLINIRCSCHLGHIFRSVSRTRTRRPFSSDRSALFSLSLSLLGTARSFSCLCLQQFHPLANLPSLLLVAPSFFILHLLPTFHLPRLSCVVNCSL